ncbi:MAG TPA: hypothetical protein VIN10_07800 [Bacteroidales bacterium]
MNKKSILKYSSLLIYILLSYSIFFMSEDIVFGYSYEDDSLVENLGALYLLVASAIFFFLYMKSKSGNEIFFIKTSKNIFLLLLAILFFVAFGEEISWGQRIFNWETSDWYSEINDQRETNLHNLTFANGLLSANRLFTLFWATYCVLVPLIDKFWPFFSRWFTKINLPIVPIWLSGFFLLSYVLSYIISSNSSIPGYGHAIVEVKETTACFLFLIFSIVLLSKQQNWCKKDLNVNN